MFSNTNGWQVATKFKDPLTFRASGAALLLFGRDGKTETPVFGPLAKFFGNFPRFCPYVTKFCPLCF